MGEVTLARQPQPAPHPAHIEPTDVDAAASEATVATPAETPSSVSIDNASSGEQQLASEVVNDAHRGLDEAAAGVNELGAVPVASSGSNLQPAGRTPLAFIWNDLYFQRVAPGDGMDTSNIDRVQDRVVKSVLQYYIDDPTVDDFAVEDVQLIGDIPSDLQAINSNARWIAIAIGRSSDGVETRVPVVMNHDGATYVDPRVRW